MKESIPVVAAEGLPRGRDDSDIKIDSDEWLDWLNAPERKSFHYRGDAASYTVSKRQNGKWYGIKKQSGSRKVKQEYIGASEKVTAQKLEAIARLFAMPDYDYWRLKHPKPSKQDKAPGVGSTQNSVYNQDQALGLGYTSNECTTVTDLSSQPQEEISKLKAEIEELEETVFQLQEKLAQTEAEVASLQLKRKQDLEFSHVRAAGLSAEIEKLKSSSRWEAEPADILNQLRQRDKKSKVSLKDVEAIVNIIFV